MYSLTEKLCTDLVLAFKTILAKETKWLMLRCELQLFHETEFVSSLKYREEIVQTIALCNHCLTS